MDYVVQNGDDFQNVNSSEEFACEVQLKKFGSFCQKFYASVANFNEFFGNERQKFAYLTHGSERIVLLDPTPYEKRELFELIETENVEMSKILLTFSSLCHEIDYLQRLAREKFYPLLLTYGQNDDHNAEESENEDLVSLSRILPFLQELSIFVERCCEVIRNIMRQFHMLYQNRSKLIDTKDLHFTTVFEHMCDLLCVLITLDELIFKNVHLKESWNSYLKSLRFVNLNSNDKFADIDRNKLKTLENVCQKLNLQLVSGYILQNCVEQRFDTEEIRISQKNQLTDEFAYEMKQILQKIELNLEHANVHTSTAKRRLVGLCGLYLLYFSVYRQYDSKLVKAICDLSKKMPFFILIGDVVWSPVEFFARSLPEDQFSDHNKKLIQNLNNEKSFFLQQITNTLQKDVQNLILRATDWLCKFNVLDTFENESLNKELDMRYELIIKGLKMASSISNITQIICNGKMSNEPLNVQICDSFFRLLELLKIVESTFCQFFVQICEAVNHLNQKLTVRLLQISTHFKDKIRTEKSTGYSNRKLDALSALSILESSCLTGPFTKTRMLIFRLTVDILSGTKTCKSDEITEFLNIFEKVKTFTYLEEHIREICDCGFMYFHRHLFPMYFKRYFERLDECSSIEYFFNVLNDTIDLTRKSSHCITDNDKSVKIYEAELDEMIKKEFLNKLCEFIENDLRLSYHTHLKLDERNPFDQTSTVKNMQIFPAIFSLPALRLGRSSIDVKRYVERYLEKTFYNLTTVALHDWRTYGEMRKLAECKYRLCLNDPQLPSQTLEQGLDTLEIMRNIHIFVTNYRYNLNDQIFIEIASNNKYLNTLNISHVTNSIRTHGTGIMSTTVNYTYQFLRKKFYVFSQFLYDDHVKSRLTKDVRYFRENKEKLNGMFPFDRAEKFVRNIRKLGSTADGSSYLDEFRRLITHIGNALGFVRMVKSGGLRACAKSVQFLTDLDDDSLISLAPFLRDSDWSSSAESIQSAERFDSLVEQMTKSFSSTAHYFKLLVDVFAVEFKNIKHIHLRNFYIIIPALTISYVEHIIQCKERLNKKNHDNAAISDDGFAMGIAYILKLLDQYNDFDSLSWFRSIYVKYSRDKANASKTMLDDSKAQGNDEKLQQTLTLTKKRIEQYNKEHELVQFALRSARIFFRTDIVKELIPKDQSDGDKSSEKSFVS